MNLSILPVLPILFLCFFAWKWYNGIIAKPYSSITEDPIRHSGVPVFIIKTARDCIRALDQLLSSNPLFVGFDCEWQSNKERGQSQRKIALIQIAHGEAILLIQIHLFRDNIPIELIAFLSNVDILKCGVGINGDARKLRNDHNLTVHGCVDLNDMYKMYLESESDTPDKTRNQRMISLETLCHLVLDEDMLYKHGIHHGFWERERLSFHQIHYSADDAFVAFKIFQSIIDSKFSDCDVMELCFGKIDTDLSSKSKKQKVVHPAMDTNNDPNKSMQHRLQSDAAYNMIAVLLPTKELLSFVPLKIGKMFVRKKWATIPSKSDFSTIQMTFIPDAINVENDNLFKHIRVLTMTSVCCVVCGYQPDNDCDEDCDDTTDGEGKKRKLLWASLIPSKFNVFPKHQDHPYRLLMCTSCEVEARRIRREFQRKMERDIWYRNNEDLQYIDTLWNTRNTAWKLKHKRKRHLYSVQEQNEFVQEVLAYCNEENMEDFVIRECDFNLEMDVDWYYNWNDWTFIVIRDCISKIIDERERMRFEHNRKRNQYLRTSLDGIGKIAYAEMWRRNFIDKMQPKFINMQQETFEIAVDRARSLKCRGDSDKS